MLRLHTSQAVKQFLAESGSHHGIVRFRVSKTKLAESGSKYFCVNKTFFCASKLAEFVGFSAHLGNGSFMYSKRNIMRMFSLCLIEVYFYEGGKGDECNDPCSYFKMKNKKNDFVSSKTSKKVEKYH